MEWKDFKITHKVTFYGSYGVKEFELNINELALLLLTVDFDKMKITKLSRQLSIFDEEE